MKNIKTITFLYFATVSLTTCTSEQKITEQARFNRTEDITYLSKYEVDRSNPTLNLLAKLILKDPNATQLVENGGERSFVYNDNSENLKICFLENKLKINTEIEIMTNYMRKKMESIPLEEDRIGYLFNEISSAKTLQNFAKLGLLLHMKLSLQNTIPKKSDPIFLNKIDGLIKHFETSCELSELL